ncbi:unnamed protein product [Medioppia subpectinata]|uniref:ethanolamine kinase n=1 Tax=Medioppia subpectinata TaxID=1979941 RepID=A0A7R9LA92_9ACAR|nr:unnamed protein product [Medioppia subpectinata]CAG2116731.1 unnamed protein product [Medioppia subpectinata]
MTEFNKNNILRGPTPPRIKEKCYDLCREYLGGVWLNVTVGDIEVKRLTGGATNQLYYCAFNEDKRLSAGDVPQEHEWFELNDQKNPILVQELAHKLAGIHTTVVPIKKTQNWIFDHFEDSYNKAYKMFDINALIDECNCETLKTHDLKEEIQWIKDLITESDSPVTFTHIDFRGHNIMVTESDGLVICDFEYGCYGCRGFDFGSLFVGWGRNCHQHLRYVKFPDDNTIRPFIDSYIKESTKILGIRFTNDIRNTFQHILKETKVFTLVTTMFLVLYLLNVNELTNNNRPFDKKKMMVCINQ